MANPLILVSLCAMFLGGLGSLFMIIPMCTETWAYYRFSETVLLGKNDNKAYKVVLVNPNETVKIYRVDHFPDKDNHTAKPSYLFAQDAGLIRICDKISAARKAASKHWPDMWKKSCYNFVTEFDEETSPLNPNGNILAKMQTSAASCLIVSIIDLITATVVGIVAILKRQVALCMVTGTLYMMAGIFGVFTLVIIYTKTAYEIDECFAFVPIPQDLCKAREITYGYSSSLVWVGVVLCVCTCGFWIFLARLLTFIKSRVML